MFVDLNIIFPRLSKMYLLPRFAMRFHFVNDIGKFIKTLSSAYGLYVRFYQPFFQLAKGEKIIQDIFHIVHSILDTLYMFQALFRPLWILIRLILFLP